MNQLLIAALAWAAVAAFSVVKLDAIAHRWLDAKANAQPTAPVELPPDLIAVAMQESEAWAQDEALKTIRERYEQFGDWNKVRSAVGVGTL